MSPSGGGLTFLATDPYTTEIKTFAQASSTMIKNNEKVKN